LECGAAAKSAHVPVPAELCDIGEFTHGPPPTK
jgi:hypothetical protein